MRTGARSPPGAVLIAVSTLAISSRAFTRSSFLRPATRAGPRSGSVSTSFAWPLAGSPVSRLRTALRRLVVLGRPNQVFRSAGDTVLHDLLRRLPDPTPDDRGRRRHPRRYRPCLRGPPAGGRPRGSAG